MSKKKGIAKRSASFEEDDDEEGMEELNFNLSASSTRHVGKQEADQEWFAASFDFCDFSEEDADSVRTLLLNGGLYDSKILETSNLASYISNQGNIGVSVKTDNDDSQSVVAILSILNLKQYEELGFLKSYLLAMVKRHANPSDYNYIEKLLEDSHSNVGYVVNERFVNLPPSLVPKMYEVIEEDIYWSQSTPEMPENERPFYFFTHFLVFTTMYEEVVNNKEKRFKQTKNFEYRKFDDEEFVKHSITRLSWPTNATVRLKDVLSDASSSSKDSSTRLYSEHKLLFVVPFKKFGQFVKKLKLLQPFNKDVKFETPK